MAQFVTQIEGEHLVMVEAETSGAFAKSELEIKANPMTAFETSIGIMTRMGRVISSRVRAELAGTGVDRAEVVFGIKCDQVGSVMIAQENEKAQFTVRVAIRVE
jgi:hypothetical protein